MVEFVRERESVTCKVSLDGLSAVVIIGDGGEVCAAYHFAKPFVLALTCRHQVLKRCRGVVSRHVSTMGAVERGNNTNLHL